MHIFRIEIEMRFQIFIFPFFYTRSGQKNLFIFVTDKNLHSNARRDLKYKKS